MPGMVGLKAGADCVLSINEKEKGGMKYQRDAKFTDGIDPIPFSLAPRSPQPLSSTQDKAEQQAAGSSGPCEEWRSDAHMHSKYLGHSTDAAASSAQTNPPEIYCWTILPARETC